MSNDQTLNVVRHACGAWIIDGTVCKACEEAYGLCPRCGKNRAVAREGGRPATYCSDTCRKMTHNEGGVSVPRDVAYNFTPVRSEWTEQAICRQVDPELFFVDGRDYYSYEYQQVMNLCNSCPVKRPCLTEGMQNKYGIWAGWTPAQRKALGEILETLPTPSARKAYLEVTADRGPLILDDINRNK